MRRVVSAACSAGKPNWSATSRSAASHIASVPATASSAGGAEHDREEALRRGVALAVAHARVERDEHDREHAAGEEVVQQVGQHERGAVGVHLRAVAEHAREHHLARDTEHARQRDARREQRGDHTEPRARARSLRSPHAVDYGELSRGSAPARPGRRRSRPTRRRPRGRADKDGRAAPCRRACRARTAGSRTRSCARAARGTARRRPRSARGSARCPRAAAPGSSSRAARAAARAPRRAPSSWPRRR